MGKIVLNPEETTVLLLHPAYFKDKWIEKLKEFAKKRVADGCEVVYIGHKLINPKDELWDGVSKDQHRRGHLHELTTKTFEEFNQKEIITNYVFSNIKMHQIFTNKWFNIAMFFKSKNHRNEVERTEDDWDIEEQDDERSMFLALMREGKELIKIMKEEKVWKKNIVITGGYVGGFGCLPSYVAEFLSDKRDVYLVQNLCWHSFTKERDMKADRGLIRFEGNKISAKTHRMGKFIEAIKMLSAWTGWAQPRDSGIKFVKSEDIEFGGAK